MYKPKFPNLYSDNRLRLIELLMEGKAPEEVIDDVLGLVDDTDYFEAPASTKYHGAEPGGLFEHSRNVTKLLVNWSRMGLIVSEEEALCIRYHMGAYEKDDWKGFDEAIQKYPNVLWTHHADMVASKLVEV